MELIHPIFKWLHILAGIIWVGLLYWFNLINLPFTATIDGETKQKITPELFPRVLYWFRWGAAWTWFTGFFLLLIVFYHGGLTFNDPDTQWSISSFVMIAVTFLGVFIYDALYKSGITSNVRLVTIISFILIGVVVLLMKEWSDFSYRSFNIHLGALFGTIMAFNVWFRIWPAQQIIIPAVKKGESFDTNLLAMAGIRSKHNTYLSVPLIWTMINQHTTVLSGGRFGVTESTNWLVLMIIVALGWHIVFQLYKKSGSVKGL
ncbi:MAG: urate hydroxylase PuuD [Fidelibacterota bacterium]